jgi:hypothetical protein
LLLGVAAVLTLIVVILRVKRDGFRVIFFESADQRWKRHEQIRMNQWARRDHQRQRFQAAMITKTNDASDRRDAPGSGNDTVSVPSAPASTSVSHPTKLRGPGSAAVMAVAPTAPILGTPLRPQVDDVPPDLANPFMTRQDWIVYLTTE